MQHYSLTMTSFNDAISMQHRADEGLEFGGVSTPNGPG